MKHATKSKTLWLNAIGLIVVALEAQTDPKLILYTAPVLLALNAILRLITKEGVGFKVKA